MSDELKIEILRAALRIVLDEEVDEKTAVTWGGYHLDEDVRNTITRALEITEFSGQS